MRYHLISCFLAFAIYFEEAAGRARDLSSNSSTLFPFVIGLYSMYTKAALLALASTAYGAVHESLAALPAGWTESSIVPRDSQRVQLHVAL